MLILYDRADDAFSPAGNIWLRGQYAIFPSADTKFQIVFEGIVGR